MPIDDVRNVYKDIEDRRVIRTEDVYQMPNENGVDGYSDKLLAVVANYCNSGVPEGCNARGMAGKSKRGEVACQLFGEVDGDTQTIEAIGFKSRGCIAMTACASQICNLVYKKSFDEAMSITAQDLIDSLDGVPASKRDAAYFATEAVRAMIGDYYLTTCGSSLEELDSHVPCETNGIACLMCEHCSLRDLHVDAKFGVLDD